MLQLLGFALFKKQISSAPNVIYFGSQIALLRCNAVSYQFCRSKDKMLSKIRNRRERLAAITLKFDPVQIARKTAGEQRERTMARSDSGYLPTANPCAQCGKPIAAPEWIEGGPGRVDYLWYCRECDYRFEAIAFFKNPEANSEALAA